MAQTYGLMTEPMLDKISANADPDVDHRARANAIRALAMDAVQKANSGHPGMPMGMADVATVLFSNHLKFDPQWPGWPDRDRFILSAGHGSMLLYALLHLTGYERPTMADIKNFRQLGSPCAGHPEYGEMPGIETTTGPLGQGIANGVGMAIAERHLASRFGDLVDHHTYVIAGDGCLMEGISHEAISLAGHLKLGKLIVLFDDNQISIDGGTDLSVSDDQKMRFTASGWHVQAVDGHDWHAVDAAIEAAKADARPSMIACRTIIGYGAPGKQGTAATHGAPLGDDEIAAARKQLDWSHAPFEIPGDILSAWRATGQQSAPQVQAWRVKLDASSRKDAFEKALNGYLPGSLWQVLADYKRGLIDNPQKVATRKASGMALEVINAALEETVGGSADLTGSNNTITRDLGALNADNYGGRYVYYGVREHAMAAAMNGMALHGGIIPYSGTFLIFSDYAKPAIRLSALMKQRVVYVMTHDSIGLGEDGPTHQPIEQLASLRATPNLHVFRPADAVETAECWEIALRSESTPSIIALSRQGLPQVRLEQRDENLSAKGAYILSAASHTPKATLIATGSEVQLALDAQKTLEAGGVATQVVSMPCADLFDIQDADYKEAVIPADTIRIGVEAAAFLGWDRYIGADGAFVGMTTFGGSAPAADLFKHFGITADHIVKAVKTRL